ncbi:hypothetical protein [uncultured Chryseobacterium sp.]|nr:hypothetical protein [uncultured Chryseobacterium sp.]
MKGAPGYEQTDEVKMMKKLIMKKKRFRGRFHTTREGDREAGTTDVGDNV